MDEIEQQAPLEKRPLLLAMLCFSVFVYSAFFVLLFSAAAVFNNWIYFVWNDFLPENHIEKSAILKLSLVGIFLYAGSFLGAFFIWRLKRIGFYLFLVFSLLIVLFPYFLGFGSIINIFVFSAMTILFLFFYRKFN